MISRAEGAFTAESWPAMPYDHYMKLFEEIRP
jgi:hypothetical protein